MQQLLDSDLEVVVASDFLYLPLLFDPSIAAELQAADNSKAPPVARGSPEADNLVVAAGRHFIKTLRLSALLEHFENLHPDAYGQLRDGFLKEHLGSVSAREEISLDDKLETIVFQVMPHFIRREGRVWGEKRTKNEELLDLIWEKIDIPKKYYGLARMLFDPELLRKMLTDLEKIEVTVEPPGEGLIPVQDLRPWVHQALTKKIVEKEKDRLRQKIRERERPLENQQAAVLLYLAVKGSLEIDGFGFSRIGKTREYLIYKRTGEYALKDFYGRLYLFPDCRVAVTTLGRLTPVVMEKYKHPFLRRHSFGQQVCLGNFPPPPAFTAPGAIAALEQGVNALFYGYNCRRRNGYHSLDRLPREERLVDFEDLRIALDHPKISAGLVEIKNAQS